MKSIFLMIAMVGVIMIVIGYVQSNQRVLPPKIEYRYIPQTFDESQNNPAPLNEVFGDMFDKNSPWETQYGFGNA